MLKVSCQASFNCVVTPAFYPMYYRYFYPRFKRSKVIHNRHANYEPQGYVAWGDNSFISSIHFKVWLVIQSLKKYKFVVWSDVDIILCKRPQVILNDLLRIIRHYDIAVSPEWRHSSAINSGFFIARSNQRTINFFEHLLNEVRRLQTAEQNIMQDLLHHNWAGVRLKILPYSYWNLTVGFPIPKNVKILHANCVAQDRGLGYFAGNNHIEKKMNALKKLKKLKPIAMI